MRPNPVVIGQLHPAGGGLVGRNGENFPCAGATEDSIACVGARPNIAIGRDPAGVRLAGDADGGGWGSGAAAPTAQRGCSRGNLFGCARDGRSVTGHRDLTGLLGGRMLRAAEEENDGQHDPAGEGCESFIHDFLLEKKFYPDAVGDGLQFPWFLKPR